ncbi:MAG TPA: SDR family oxidoreductase [Gaiellales bacterium]|nr:SDR family oxidoreductase [Gaiellales bacterium]
MHGTVALVSGGGSGIGAATARSLAAAGARVAVMGRRREPVEQAAAGIGGLACIGDSAVAEDAERAVAETTAAFGGLDVLVANAGGEGSAAVLDIDDGMWDAVMRSNLTSCFVLARAALPAIVERSGAIVVVSSVSGLFAIPNDAGYTAAKHALIGLTRSLARDYGPRGVRVNAVCPAWTRTPIGDASMDRLGARRGTDREGAYALCSAHVPLRRPVTAEEVAAACVFLASPAASGITGAVLPVDGGSSAVDLSTAAFDDP